MLKKNIVTIGMLLFSISVHAAEFIEYNYDNKISLGASIEKFNSKENKIKYCGDNTCIINGAPVFGTDGDIPGTVLTKLVFKQAGSNVELNVRGMYNTGINKQNMGRVISVRPYWRDFYKITGRFSDGAAAYIVQWIASRHGSIRSYIGDAESLYDLYYDTFKPSSR